MWKRGRHINPPKHLVPEWGNYPTMDKQVIHELHMTQTNHTPLANHNKHNLASKLMIFPGWQSILYYLPRKDHHVWRLQTLQNPSHFSNQSVWYTIYTNLQRRKSNICKPHWKISRGIWYLNTTILRTLLNHSR